MTKAAPGSGAGQQGQPANTNQANGQQQSSSANSSQPASAALDEIKNLLQASAIATAPSQTAAQQQGGQWSRGGTASSSVTTPGSTTPTMAQQQNAQAAQGGNLAPKDRKELVTKLKSLESAMAQLPDGEGFQTIKDQMESERQAIKRTLDHAKPLGSRQDRCRRALAQAKTSVALLQEAANLATIALREAQAAVLEKEKELKELELESSGAPDNSLLALQRAMMNVVTDMGHGAVDPVVHQAAQVEMESLFLKLSSLSTSCTQAGAVGTGAHQVGAPQQPASVSVLQMLQHPQAPGLTAANAQTQQSAHQYDISAPQQRMDWASHEPEIGGDDEYDQDLDDYPAEFLPSQGGE